MTSNKRPADGMPRTVRRILGGVLVALAGAGLLVVLSRKEPEPSPSGAVPAPAPEVSFEEKLLAVVPEGLEYAGAFVCGDGRHLAFSAHGKRAPAGSQQRAVVDGLVGDEHYGVDIRIAPDLRTFAILANGNPNVEAVDVGPAKGQRYMRVDGFTFSPDSKTYAYRAQKGGTSVVVVGTTEQAAFEAVGEPAFSRDGGTVFYTAQRGPKACIVVGDQVHGLEFDHVADPAVSPDGKRVAFTATRKHVTGFPLRREVQKAFVVVDGSKGEEFDAVGPPCFSPDGRSVAYLATQAPNRGKAPFVQVVHDGRKGESFSSIRELGFGPDGKILLYQASSGQGWFQVVGSRKGETFDDVGKPVFNAAGTTFAYVAQRNGKFRVVVGDHEGEAFNRVDDLRFARDGKTPVYSAWLGDRRFLVSNGQKTEDLRAGDFENAHLGAVSRMICSPDGKTFAYRAGACVIVGERRIDVFAATDPVFNEDGSKVAFGSVVHSGGRSELWWRVISGPFTVEPDPKAPPPTREAGLVGYWRLDEAEATRAYDSSGRGNHGDYYHAPEASTDVARFKFENPSSRLFVKGLPQRVEIPESPSLSLQGSLTLAAWIRPAVEERPVDRGILVKGDWLNRKNWSGGYSLRLSRNEQVVFGVRPPRVGTQDLVAPPRVAADTWTHVAGVYDAQSRTSRIYLNGALVASQGSMPPPHSSPDTLRIGSDDAEGQFHGKLDELRVYRRALSDPEVLALASGEGSTLLRVDDARTRQQVADLGLEGHLKDPDRVTMADLESAARDILAARKRSAGAIAFLGTVYGRSSNAPLRLEIVRVLTEAVRDPNPNLLRAAATALGYAGPSPAVPIEVLGDALKRTSDKSLRSVILYALGGQGWGAAPAMLVALAGDHTAPGEYTRDCPDLVEFAAWLCKDVHSSAIDGKSSPSILPQLQAAASGPDRAVRVVVAQILGTYAGRSGESYARVSAAFLPLIEDPDVLVRRRALRAFAETLVGSPHERELYRSALPPLFKAIRDPHANVRCDALWALGYLAALSRPAIAYAHGQALGDPDKGVRGTASFGLETHFPAPPLPGKPLPRVAQVGGSGGGPFLEVAPRGGHLVGLRVTTWINGDHLFIKSLLPLYRVGDRPVVGQVHGGPAGAVQETLARPGYAIGGFVAQGSDRLDGLMAVFMKLTPSGLDPTDQYLGAWLGGRQEGKDVYLGTNEASVVGVSGRQGADIDAFGVILDPRVKPEAAPVATKGEGFLSRWLVLGALPLGKLAADSDAALDKAWIPDLKDVRPKPNDPVRVGDVDFEWRVQDTSNYALQLGETENSVSIAMTWIVSDRDVPEATLLTGSDDGAIWFLNGQEVHRHVGRRPLRRDQDRTARPVSLKKGVNVLVAVVSNGGSGTGACARFVDAAGRPLQVLAGAEPPH